MGILSSYNRYLLDMLIRVRASREEEYALVESGWEEGTHEDTGLHLAVLEEDWNNVKAEIIRLCQENDRLHAEMYIPAEEYLSDPFVQLRSVLGP